MKKYLFVLSGAIVALMSSVGIHATTVPYNMYVVPGTYSCLVTWADDDNSAWNLRYRPYSEEPEVELIGSIDGTSYNSQNYQAVTLTAPWSGRNVYGGKGAIYFRNSGHQSATTDGYIKFTIPGDYQNIPFTVKITTASGQYGSGRFVVGSTQTADVQYNMSATETHSWVVIGSTGEVITITSPETQYSPDIALLEIYTGDATARAYEWTYVYNLDNKRYTIENLEPETDYEVQVQAIGAGGALSDWTRPDVFTTYAVGEEPITPDVHILGEVDGQEWAYDAGTKMVYDPVTELYTATVHAKAGATFGFTTEIDPDGELGEWNYVNQFRFGPEINGVGPFDLTEDRLGLELPLSWDWDHFSDVHVLSTGDYEITVSLEQSYVIIGKLNSTEFIRGDVTGNGFVDMDDLTALINYLLDGSYPINMENSAACNNVNDTAVDMDDLTALINFLLTNSWD